MQRAAILFTDLILQVCLLNNSKFHCVFPSGFFRLKVPHRSPNFPSSHFGSCQDLLNKALNQKKCKNEKSIKLVFTYEKVILYYHNVLFN